MKYKLTGSKEGTRLSELLTAAGADARFPCSGNHACGKCKVRATGCLSPVSPSEAAMLTGDELRAGVRMACFAKACGDVIVETEHRGGERIVAECSVVLDKGEPLFSPERIGAAVDIGTTTIVCRLYAHDGRMLAEESALNAQYRFGADVISRINYGIANGNEALHRTITSQIETLLARATESAAIETELIETAVVTGNTTMLHFFAGLDPKGIGFAPFVPKSLFDDFFSNLLQGIKTYLPPCVSAYVGADLTCCLLASGLCSKDETSLIIDVGTNGEMALFSNGRLFCCSTAAGPAFEGSGITDGMTAGNGAISHCRFDGQTVTYETIGEGKALGLCGSGVVDAVAALLDGGALAPCGRLAAEGPLAHNVSEGEDFFTFPGSAVRVTQKDIRKIQLAKAAIYAGAETLAQKSGMSADDIDVLYLCGGFGSFLDLKSAETIGLIPRGLAEKTVVLGNAALGGAAALLLDRAKINEIKDIARRCEYIELSNDETFMENYVTAMSFGDIDEDN